MESLSTEAHSVMEIETYLEACTGMEVKHTDNRIRTSSYSQDFGYVQNFAKYSRVQHSQESGCTNKQNDKVR